MKMIKYILAILLSLSIVACSGGGGSYGGSSTPASYTYNISGTTTFSGNPLLGATIYLTGTRSATTTTDSNGNYSFTGLANGSYTVTPSGLGYTYTPISIDVAMNGANVTGKNFVAQ